ncbi:hypothetical protein ACCT30_11845, partial [Rhizobium ruizarguesonis]
MPPIENGPAFPGRFCVRHLLCVETAATASGRPLAPLKNPVDKPGQMAKSMTLKGDTFRNNG